MIRSVRRVDAERMSGERMFRIETLERGGERSKVVKHHVSYA